MVVSCILPSSASKLETGGAMTKHPTEPTRDVVIRDAGMRVVVEFPSDARFGSEAAVVAIRLEPEDGEPFEPARLAPELGVYVERARAKLAQNQSERVAALETLGEIGGKRRGHPPEFYENVARQYEDIVSGGTQSPVGDLADANGVKISAASRWLKEARDRKFIAEVKP
jgi:hypothetical protein